MSCSQKSFGWGRPLAAALCLLLATACATPPPPAAPPPSVKQALVFRVLDARDRPVAGARVRLKALAGGPESPGPHFTDPKGELRLNWKPRVESASRPAGIYDQIFSITTRLEYQVGAPGFFPAGGVMAAEGRTRRMASPELRSLDRRDRPTPLTRVVVLRRTGDLYGGELSRRPAGDALLRRLADFHQSMSPVTPHLGVEFAWPAFSLRNRELTVAFNWRGAVWSGLAQAPLQAQMTASAGMPLALACGQELLPLPGVERVRLLATGEIPQPNDPYAMPERATWSLAAPARDMIDLARGALSPREFLRRNTPAVEITSPPASRPRAD